MLLVELFALLAQCVRSPYIYYSYIFSAAFVALRLLSNAKFLKKKIATGC